MSYTYFTATDREMEDIFRLRYKCYRRGGAISSNTGKFFCDKYDGLANTAVYGIRQNNKLVASIRLHTLTSTMYACPAWEAFGDYVSPVLEQHSSAMEGSRFVVDPMVGRTRKHLALFALQLPLRLAIKHEIEIGLAAVREKHIGFYKTAGHFKQVSEPRPYHGLKTNLALLQVNIPQNRILLKSAS